ncbi:helix-turn-helix transcriptional regulator [Kutzneria sp. CA-103260]|uniref:helix-turn-helix transcriptional regulator n=1 Tax=Kutzneria sp. CA-103260 TaxID=2802641 RepID=UPI001BA5DF65|nr:LuxR family transcriptional regulator [Kutzneria sp. CA-103260]QUQ72372.1 LuxR family transcriptional regulator [Kutzneria sp. CA-103260]
MEPELKLVKPHEPHTSSLAERATELAALESVLTTCAQGRGSAVLITGSVATGKTELMNHFVEHMVADDVVTLTAAAAPHALPFAVLRQLLDNAAVRDRAVEIVELVNDAVEWAMTLDGDADEMRRLSTRVMAAVRTAVAKLTRGGPVVVVVDDVQDADAASLLCLTDLVRATYQERVVFVFAAQHQLSPNSALFGELLRHPRYQRLWLRALSLGGVQEVLTANLSGSVARRLAGPATAISGGNPLLLRALLVDYGVAANSGGRLMVGRSYCDAVANCLRRSDELAGPVGRGIAVLGEETSIALLADLVDEDAERVAAIVELLGDAGVLDGLAFRHETVAATLLNTMDNTEFEDLHYRAAQLLLDAGAQAIPVAEHLVAARRGDYPWSVGVLIEAAELASAGDRVGFATQCLQLAVNCCPDERRRGKIVTMLAGMEWQVNPTAGVRHLDKLVAAMRAGELAERDATELVHNLLWHGRTDDALHMIEVMAAEAGATSLRTAIERRIIALTVAASFPSLNQQVRTSLLAAPAVSGAVAEPRLQAASALATVLTRGVDDETLADAEQVLQSTRLNATTVVPLKSAVLALVYADRLDKAVPWCDTLLKEAQDRRAPGWHTRMSEVRAIIAVRQGDLPLAVRCAKAAFAAYSAPYGGGVGIGSMLAVLISAATSMGHMSEAAEYVARPLAQSVLKTRHGLHYLHARGRFHLESGHARAALADFLACGDLIRQWNMDRPTVVPWRSSAALALLELGHTTQARALVDKELAIAGEVSSRARGKALRVKAAVSELELKPALLQLAVDDLEAAGDRLSMAYALAELSTAQGALGEHDKAWTTVRRAWLIAKSCQAEALCQHLMKQSNVVGPIAGATPRAESAQTLSRAERRVAKLAAIGYTNREIAARLYITVSTVEQHLTRVYRKLNVNRRSELSVSLQVDIATSA